jgi:hypothetical protein
MATYHQSEKPSPIILNEDPVMLEKALGSSEAVVDHFLGQETSAINKALLRKQDFRLIPICATMYLLAVSFQRNHPST